jgi:hypothetical protein
VQQQYAAAVQGAIDRGVDPNEDPDVQRLADAVTSIQRQSAQKTPSELQTYLQQNPGSSVQDFWNDKNKSRASGRVGARPTEAQMWLQQNPGAKLEDFWAAKYGAASAPKVQSAVVRRSVGLNKLAKFRPDGQTGTYTDQATGVTLSQGEYQDAVNRIESQFDQELNALVQNPSEVRSHVDKSALTSLRSAQVPTNNWQKK